MPNTATWIIVGSTRRSEAQKRIMPLRSGTTCSMNRFRTRPVIKRKNSSTRKPPPKTNSTNPMLRQEPNLDASGLNRRNSQSRSVGSDRAVRLVRARYWLISTSPSPSRTWSITATLPTKPVAAAFSPGCNAASFFSSSISRDRTCSSLSIASTESTWPGATPSRDTASLLAGSVPAEATVENRPQTATRERISKARNQ